MATVPLSPATLAALAEERFVSLTTFRASGRRVSTPVWIAADGNALIVTTPRASGNVKRLRRDARIELRPCGRFGRVDPSTTAATGAPRYLEATPTSTGRATSCAASTDSSTSP